MYAVVDTVKGRNAAEHMRRGFTADSTIFRLHFPNRHDPGQFLPTSGLVRSGWSCAPDVVSTSFCWWVCWITEVALLVTGAGLTTYVEEVDNVDVYIIRNLDADLHGFPSNSEAELYLIRMRIRIQVQK